MKKRRSYRRELVAILMAIILAVPIIPQMARAEDTPQDMANGFYTYTYNQSLGGYQVGLTPEFRLELNKATGGVYSGKYTTGAQCYYWASTTKGLGNGSSPENASNKLPNPDPEGMYHGVNVTSMTNMFCQCNNLTSLDLSQFNTSNVILMRSMFGRCSNLTNLDTSHFDTPNLTNIGCMFYDCSNLTSLNLSHFDTSNVTAMDLVFQGCSSLTSLNLSHFNTSKVTEMSHMFYNCRSLTSLDLSSFDLSSIVYDIGHYKYGITNMFSQTCSNTTGSAITGYAKDPATAAIFNNCSDSSPVPGKEFLGNTGIDPTKLQFQRTTFYDYNYDTATNGYKASLSSEFKTQVNAATGGSLTVGSTAWKTGDTLPAPAVTYNDITNGEHNVTSLAGMFQSCGKMTSLDLSQFNTAKITDMSEMLASCTDLKTLDLSQFDISSIQYDAGSNRLGLQGMFNGTCASNTTGYALVIDVKDTATAAAFNNNTNATPSQGTVFLGNTNIDPFRLIFKAVTPDSVYIPVFIPPFYQVTDLTGIPVSVDEGTIVTLDGTVEPSNATNKTITWSIKDPGTTNATVTGSSLTTGDPGNLILTATIKNGLFYGVDYTKDFTITVNQVLEKPGQISWIKAKIMGKRTIRITWGAAKDAVSYKVYRSYTKKGPYVLVGTVKGTKKMVRNLKPGTRYYFKVRAVNEAGITDSKIVSAKTRALRNGSHGSGGFIF